MVAVRNTLALDEVIAAAEAISDPTVAMMDDLDARYSAGTLPSRDYVARAAALFLAMLAEGET